MICRHRLVCSRGRGLVVLVVVVENVIAVVVVVVVVLLGRRRHHRRRGRGRRGRRQRRRRIIPRRPKEAPFPNISSRTEEDSARTNVGNDFPAGRST